MVYEVQAFSHNLVRSYFETEEHLPLIVTPIDSSHIDFMSWAREHQQEIATAVKEYGAIVFQGFGLTKEVFGEAFTAATGMRPQKYQGDTPREEIESLVYHSTAVDGSYKIPLHQEVSSGNREMMPKYLSFFCETPAKEGTGRTLLGSAEKVTEKIKEIMPDFWDQMSRQSLTYTARYLPKEEWRTHWIRWLNPSHGTIESRFQTEEKSAVEALCIQEGATCTWDKEWAVVSRSGVPGTITIDGKTLFCNQIHVEKLNPTLCGGSIGYYLARLFLYPTVFFRQFDVEFDGGLLIEESDAASLLSIISGCEIERDWQKGELLILDNVRVMHGKTRHEGIREIFVAMAGSITH